ncbi:MAG TPA: potassium-transporting ATPase subunit KdpC [Miltoncostaea sp.]|jgi:K+-transporting ATPase ATPase C chain|nr:potassium-transporting ATPase subunit KdpC [Miltoncostaea sp.]
MTRVLRPLGTGLAMIALMTVVLGLLYPLAMTGVLQGLFPSKADGSLVRVDGTVVGTDLAGQVFTSPAYFHSRPSATTPPYDPSATTFANLGPNTVALQDAVRANIAAALKLERPYNPGLTAKDLPVDMVTTSGSGVDPDITPANARLQANRIAAVRGLSRDEVDLLIDDNTSGRSLGVFGQPRVNVLRLNIALDRLAGAPVAR